MGFKCLLESHTPFMEWGYLAKWAQGGLLGTKHNYIDTPLWPQIRHCPKRMRKQRSQRKSKNKLKIGSCTENSILCLSFCISIIFIWHTYILSGKENLPLKYDLIKNKLPTSCWILFIWGFTLPSKDICFKKVWLETNLKSLPQL